MEHELSFHGQHNDPTLLSPLTQREVDILRLVLSGFSNQGIARKLYLTSGTVKWYTKQIYSKLGVHSRDEAVALARGLRLLDDAPADAASKPAPPAYFPSALVSLVGREAEIAALSDLLRADGVRLLTLVGPPGIGKTRLSQHVGAEVRRDFADSAVFVELAAVRDPAQVAGVIAGALGIPEAQDRTAEDALKVFLHDKHLLLVLDNFEQITEASPLVAALLKSAPNLKVLVTSREALRLSAERVFHVPALDPADAVSLFAQRAQAVNPAFRITEDNAGLIREICLRLDGLPLAIELAAARIRILTPQTLLKRLDSRLNVLTQGSRDLPDRQQTLRATIDWSYHLLKPDEQTMFMLLAVFSGGWTLDAAEVTGAAAGARGFDALESLLMKSLVYQTEGVSGDLRFSMLESLREYGLEKLAASGREADFRRAHADWCIAFAERAHPELRRAQQILWAHRLEDEHDNFRVAMQWAYTARDAERLMRLTGALGWFWFLRTHLTDGNYWTEAALEMDDERLPKAVRAKACNSAGFLAFMREQHVRAAELHGKALTLYRDINDLSHVACSLWYLSAQTVALGDPHAAIAQIEEAMALAKTFGAADNLRAMYINLQTYLVEVGDIARSEAVAREGLQLARAHDDKHSMIYLLSNLAEVMLECGDLAEAEALLNEAMPLARELGDRRMMAAVIQNQAGVLDQRGCYADALAGFEQAIALAREAGDTSTTSMVLVKSAYTAQRAGDLTRAATLAREALNLCRTSDNGLMMATALEQYASICAALGDSRLATRLYGTTAGWWAATKSFRFPRQQAQFDSDTARLQSALGEAAFAGLWAQGETQTLAQAIGSLFEP